jgi:isopropylmalate/homocitrate/citramalate synthase
MIGDACFHGRRYPQRFVNPAEVVIGEVQAVHRPKVLLRLGSCDKLTLARQLARLKVDIIEAGYPASSPEDFEAVLHIARKIEGPIICGLSRAVPEDIEACGKALAKAKRPRVHITIGVSDT